MPPRFREIYRGYELEVEPDGVGYLSAKPIQADLPIFPNESESARLTRARTGNCQGRGGSPARTILMRRWNTPIGLEFYGGTGGRRIPASAARGNSPAQRGPVGSKAAGLQLLYCDPSALKELPPLRAKATFLISIKALETHTYYTSKGDPLLASQ